MIIKSQVAPRQCLFVPPSIYKTSRRTSLKSTIEPKFNQDFFAALRSSISWTVFEKSASRLRTMFLQTHGVGTPSIRRQGKSFPLYPSPPPVCRHPPMDPIRPPSGRSRQPPSPPTTLAPARDRPEPGGGGSGGGDGGVGGK